MAEVAVFNLAELSRSFATRTRGEEVALRVGDIIAREKPGTMVVSWSGVNAASPSFLDAFVSGIRESVDTEPSRSDIVFTGVDEGFIGLVDIVLRRREFPIKHVTRADNLDESPTNILGDPPRQSTVLA
jgi:hypothetical protein